MPINNCLALAKNWLSCRLKIGSRRLYSRAWGGMLVLGMVVLFSGCAATWPSLQREAATRQFSPHIFTANGFALNGFLKNLSVSAERPAYLVVYIEGDGRAFRGNQPSSDPSPANPTAFALAMQDPAPKVLYLARLGQYNSAYAQPGYQTYWSDRRLAPEMVELASQAIDQAKDICNAQQIHLLGFSGGGGLACLLAAQRDDVLSLTTVAGLLSIKWWVANLKLRPMPQSLDPEDYVGFLIDLPQTHFYGFADKIIPPGMSAYWQSLASFDMIQRFGVHAGHNQGWTEAWPELLQKHIVPLR